MSSSSTRGTPPRITQTGQVYYDPGDGGRLFTVPLTGTDRLVQGGDPYVRTMVVDEDWRALETGHITSCSLMVLVNEPTVWDRNPTDDQRLEAAARVVELSHGRSAPSHPLGENTTPLPTATSEMSAKVPRTMFSSPVFSPRGAPPPAPTFQVDRLIYPGECDKGVPTNLSSLRVRCRKGTSICTLYLFPA